MSSYLEDLERFLRKVQIGVEGCIGIALLKAQDSYLNRAEENFRDSKELVGVDSRVWHHDSL